MSWRPTVRAINNKGNATVSEGKMVSAPLAGRGRQYRANLSKIALALIAILIVGLVAYVSIILSDKNTPRSVSYKPADWRSEIYRAMGVKDYGKAKELIEDHLKYFPNDGVLPANLHEIAHRVAVSSSR